MILGANRRIACRGSSHPFGVHAPFLAFSPRSGGGFPRSRAAVTADRSAGARPLPPGDVDHATGQARLSYSHAETLFKAASGGATLHQLRHSALIHDAEDGTSTPMLMARSGHLSVRSLAKYARVSAEALQRHQAERYPARRRPW
jgi:integrase